MKIIGLDTGKKRIGVAISDELLLTAVPHSVIKADNGLEHAAIQIAKLCKENDVSLIVIGLPLTLGGGQGGTSINLAKSIKKMLEKLVDIKITFHDERLSTTEAEKLLLRQNIKRKKRRMVIDKVAAAIILQGYLDSR